MTGDIVSLDKASQQTGSPTVPSVLPEPSSISVTNLIATSSTVSWTAALGGAIVKYKVVYSAGAVAPADCAGAGSVVASTTLDLLVLNADTLYSVRVCSVDPNDPSRFSTGITGSFKTLIAVVRAAAISSARNWNDYIVNDGTKYYNPSGIDCPIGASGNFYGGCINGGILQKIALASSVACSRIKTIDRLGVFRWGCDSSGATTIIYSTGMQSYKGLSDLISGHSFLNNYVVVAVDGVQAYASAPEAWWSNPIEEVPSSPAGGSVNLANSGSIGGKIFTVSATQTSGSYAITENKVSLVVMRGAELIKDSSNATPVVTTTMGVKYLWLEGKFNGNNVSDPVLSGYQISQSRLHNIEVRNAAAGTGILLDLRNSYQVLCSDFFIHHGVVGVEQNVSSYRNTMVNGRLSHISNLVINYMYYGTVTNVIFSNNVGGEQFAYPNYSIMNNITFVNNTGNYGARLFFTHNNLFHSVLSSNASSRSFYGWRGFASTFSQIMSAGSSAEEIAMSTTEEAHKFTNNIVLESAGECAMTNNTAFSPGLAVGTCLASGPLSDAIVTFEPIDQTKLFGAKVAVDDNVSGVDVSGLATLAAILDWTALENPFRLWGPDGGVFPTGTNAGLCSSGACRIWDYRLKADPINPAWNRSGNPSALNGSFVAGSACPSELNGNKVTTYFDGTVTKTFLTNAYEVYDDGVGNDNGLCESGEACIYTPNFGAYQGEGDYLSQGTCTFQDGTISGVKMYAYPKNGI